METVRCQLFTVRWSSALIGEYKLPNEAGLYNSQCFWKVISGLPNSTHKLYRRPRGRWQLVHWATSEITNNMQIDGRYLNVQFCQCSAKDILADGPPRIVTGDQPSTLGGPWGNPGFCFFRKHWIPLPNHVAKGHLKHWGWDRVADISKMLFSSAFYSMKMFAEVCSQGSNWFRYWLGAEQVASHYLNQWCIIYWCIYASLSLNELIKKMGII